MGVKILKSILVWLLIVPAAILNGTFREYILVPTIGEKISLPLSGVSLCLLIFVIAYFVLTKVVGKAGLSVYVAVGVLWFILTNLFEVVVMFISGAKFSMIANAYNPASGNLWLFVVIFVLVAPPLVMKLRESD